jgi:hypothetical protein
LKHLLNSSQNVHEVENCNTTLWGCNTNNSSLYGLIRAGKAFISRLAIPEFKPKSGPEVVSNHKRIAGFTDNPEHESDNEAAFYDHLIKECEVVDGFESDECYEQEYQTLNHLKSLNLLIYDPNNILVVSI